MIESAFGHAYSLLHIINNHSCLYTQVKLPFMP